MENGVHPPASEGARAAVLLAERAVARALDVGPLADAGPHGANAFGEAVAVLPPLDVPGRVQRLIERASSGERVGFVASAAELLGVTGALGDVVARRLGVVVHLLEANGVEAALALAQLGWAMLFASSAEESLDLALVARRAAEDSGTPFFVVHDAVRGLREPSLGPLAPAFVEAFVGAAHDRAIASPAEGQRAFAERVPFALASALRQLEALTGRKRDVVHRNASASTAPAADPSLVLVGLGALGDALLGEVARLRALGHDVGAVKVTALRPFPGPRLVRLLARALAVTVVESVDEPLAQSNALTRELKAGFSDALTWAPDYPGVGRIPRVHACVVRGAAGELASSDVDAIVHNMLAGDHGKRFFVVGEERAQGVDQSARGVVTV
jgi:pyruvate-ferredoxin/flavodoxin oxidoreductase